VGDNFQSIADIDASPEEAESLAAAVLHRLIAEGVLEAERTPCLLGRDELGHRPGPHHVLATGGSPAWRGGVNGLEVVTGRTVFHCIDVIERIACPHCRADAGAHAWHDLLSPAIDEWYSSGEGVRGCPHCGRPLGLNEWEWSPLFAFGHLGFTFWNWPPLDPGFVAAVSERLEHRVVLTYGKL
jgi:hypothetical protein